ncbi:hypothetical protein BGX38DRAFT_824414 [Terfezia claveryi]|nr:hypothetical protein BGX38DRAFT_824414 [Terfezia claveryi]
MSAASPAAALPNPVYDEETLLFYLTPERILACDRYEEDPGADTVFTDNGAKANNYAVPGAISAVMRRGVVTIYGMMANEVKTDPDDVKSNISTYTISQFSPLNNPVAKGDTMVTTYPSALSAVSKYVRGSEKDDNCWFYFLKGIFGSPPQLTESHQEGNKKAGVVIYSQPRPIPISFVAAYYHPPSDHRVVFFQGADDDAFPIQYIVTTATGATPQSIPETDSGATKGTPLAVTASVKNGVTTLYVYFVNRAHYLTKCSAVLDQTGAPGPWTTPVAVRDSVKVDQNSQLTARTNDDQNRVFYIKTRESVYSSVFDKL